MHYIFSSNMLSQNGQLIQAEIQGVQPTLFDKEYDWLSDYPIDDFPVLTFNINSMSPLLDNYWTGTLYSLYSENLLKILSEQGIRFQTFTVNIVDRVTNKLVGLKYYNFRLLETHESLDHDQSIFEVEDGPVPIARLRKLVLTESFLLKRIPICRIKEKRNLVIVSEKFKDTLERTQITGCRFIPIDSI